MAQDNKSVTPIHETPEPIFPIKGEIGMEDVAAIKVAEVENTLMRRTEELRAQLSADEKALQTLEAEFSGVLLEDAFKEHPALKKLQEALKELFGKSFSATAVLNKEKDKVLVQVAGDGTFPWKGKASKRHHAEMEETRARITKTETDIIDAKKKLGQLPSVERSAKAAIARMRLSGSKEGQEILKRLDTIALPGLSGPKSK